MKRELLGFWQLRLAKSKRPFCAPAPPKQAHGEPWTRHSTLWAAVGTSTTPGADKTGTWAFTMSCWEVFCWVFSLGGFTYTRHNWEIVCFLPSKTANSWELTVSDGCTARSCKPAWSCQKIKYLEKHTGLNQTERQPCKRTAEKKNHENSSWYIGWVFFPWLHGLGMSQ